MKSADFVIIGPKHTMHDVGVDITGAQGDWLVYNHAQWKGERLGQVLAPWMGHYSKSKPRW